MISKKEKKYIPFSNLDIIPLENPNDYKEKLIEIIEPFLIEGKRHNLIFAITGILRRCGFTKEFVLELFNSLEDREIKIDAKQTVPNVFRKSNRLPGYVYIQKSFTDEESNEAKLLISNLSILLNAIDPKKKVDLDKSFLPIDEKLADNALFSIDSIDLNKKYSSIYEGLEAIKPIINELWNKTPLTKYQAQAIDIIAKTIIKNDYFITIKNTKLNYHYEKGYYVLGADSIIEEYAEKVLDQNCDNKSVKEILGKITRLTYKEETIFDTDPKLVCVENGILNILTKDLIPHSPDYYFLQKIPITYDPNKQCPVFQSYLIGVIPQIERKKDRETLVQFLGYCLYRDVPISQFLILNGFGRNGKGTFLELATRFVGESVSNLGIENLQDKDASSELLGKLLNAAGEIGEVKVKELKLLKGVTGRDRIRIRFLYKGGFSAKIYAKFLFANNQLPKFKDKDDAIFERLLILDFNERFDSNNVKTDLDLINKLTSEDELSGILNLALEGLEKLFKEKHFACFTSIEENRERLLPKIDPIKNWIDSETDFDSNSKIAGNILYNSYQAWAITNNYPCESRNQFYVSILSFSPGYLLSLMLIANAKVIRIL